MGARAHAYASYCMIDTDRCPESGIELKNSNMFLINSLVKNSRVENIPKADNAIGCRAMTLRRAISDLFGRQSAENCGKNRTVKMAERTT